MLTDPRCPGCFVPEHTKIPGTGQCAYEITTPILWSTRWKVIDCPGERRKGDRRGKVPCCICGRPVCTKELDEPGASPDGSELEDGRWVCSHACWDVATSAGVGPEGGALPAADQRQARAVAVCLEKEISLTRRLSTALEALREIREKARRHLRKYDAGHRCEFRSDCEAIVQSIDARLATLESMEDE